MPTAFFYGTLMHPKILTKVIGNDGSHLEICPAVLLNHTRHRVKNADYPGVVPYERGKELFDRELSQEERSVRGTLVRNLTLADINHLDVFEGHEYIPLPISVHPLSSFTALSLSEGQAETVLPTHTTPLPQISDLASPVDAHTYIYRDIRDLEPRLWSWDDFVRKNAWKWYGGAPNPSEAASGNGLGASPMEDEVTVVE